MWPEVNTEDLVPKVSVTVAGQSASGSRFYYFTSPVFYPKKDSVSGSHLTVAVTEINSAGMVFQRAWLAWF